MQKCTGSLIVYHLTVVRETGSEIRRKHSRTGRGANRGWQGNDQAGTAVGDPVPLQVTGFPNRG